LLNFFPLLYLTCLAHAKFACELLSLLLIQSNPLNGITLGQT
jgi:hypothetical protein